MGGGWCVGALVGGLVRGLAGGLVGFWHSIYHPPFSIALNLDHYQRLVSGWWINGAIRHIIKALQRYTGASGVINQGRY